MNNLGNKIKEIRKTKGMSQEDLADLAKVNLRTVQRIENNESEPHGKTLRMICDSLGVNLEEIMEYGKNEDVNFLVWFHLSVLSFIIVPLGNIILPLILWMTKKDSISGLQKIGANLLNFQIIWAMFSFLALIGFALFKIMHWPGANILLVLWMALLFINFIFSIVHAVFANNGKPRPFYPNLIRFVK